MGLEYTMKAEPGSEVELIVYQVLLIEIVINSKKEENRALRERGCTEVGSVNLLGELYSL